MAWRRQGGLTDRELDDILNQSETDELEEDENINYSDDYNYSPSQSSNRSSDESSSDSGDQDSNATEELSLQNLSASSIARGRISSRRSRGRGFRSQRGRINRRATTPATAEAKQWTSKRYLTVQPQIVEPAYLPIDSEKFTKFDYFAQYIDEEVIENIVEKTNQTAVSIIGRTINFTKKECKIFIGITMIMSCINYPILRMYWENKWRVAIIADNMARNRFFQIRTSLKVVFDADISEENRKKDRLWKVRPILEKVLTGCRKQHRNQHICIDEMIIPFTGNCGIKQYCPGKPNPVGLKAMVLANPDGTVCDFLIYQGETTYQDTEYAEFKSGEKAVLKLTETLVPGHIIYFDRYFTTANLAEELDNIGMKCTGTLMKNRIPGLARDILQSDHSMKSKGRGSHQVIVRNDEKMAITKWFDNKPVIMLSSVHSNAVIDECNRCCKKGKQYVSVKRPEVVKLYNSNMGGVDLADRMLAVCPARSRTKKWTVRFISHMFDLAVSNSWILYRKDQLKKNVPLKKIQQLRFFKMELGEILVEDNAMGDMTLPIEDSNTQVLDRKRGRPAVVPLPSKLMRLHGAIHMPEMDGVQHKCRREGCKKKTCVKCTSCNIFLCLTKERNCFKEFHE